MSERVRLRTCIATRRRLPDTDLLRVVIDHDDPHGRRLVADPHRRLPGRGAWISPTLSALELAERKRAFKRALRTSAPVDTGQVRQYQVRQYLEAHGGQVPSVEDAALDSYEPELQRKTEH